MSKEEGGLHTEGRFTKKSRSNQPLVSVITVVRNDEQHIEATIKNVIQQSYANIEYIVIDGASTDNTLKIVKQHNDYIAYWLSEPDNGIYDAMNKGLQAATGDYVWFINSGDRIFTDETAILVFSKFPESDVYYGDTMIIDNEGVEVGLRRLSPPPQLEWRALAKGMLVCHQALIVKRSLAEEYDLRYSQSADYDWMIRILKQADRVQNTNLLLARFLDGGSTKNNLLKGLWERFVIMNRHYGLFGTLLNHFLFIFRFFTFFLRHRRY